MKRFLLVAVAVLIVSAMSFGQQSSTDVEYAVTVAALGGPLTLAVGSGPVWDALKPGQAYVSIADQNYNVANLSPYDVNQGESFTPGDLTITGSPGAQVALQFIMPAKLFGTAIGRGFGCHAQVRRTFFFSFPKRSRIVIMSANA